MELSDLEICTEIAKIECELESLEEKVNSYNSRLVHVQDKVKINRFYNPLRNNALCFKLMVGHGVVVFHHYENDVFVCWAEYADGCGEIGERMTGYVDSELEAIKRCICLAIIEKEK